MRTRSSYERENEQKQEIDAPVALSRLVWLVLGIVAFALVSSALVSVNRWVWYREAASGWHGCRHCEVRR